MNPLPKKRRESCKRRSTQFDLQDLQYDDSMHTELDFPPDTQHIDTDIRCQHSTDYLLEVLRDMFPGSHPDILQQVWDRHKPDLDAAVCQLTQDFDSTHAFHQPLYMDQEYELSKIDNTPDWPQAMATDEQWEAFDDLWQQQASLWDKHVLPETSQRVFRAVY